VGIQLKLRAGGILAGKTAARLGNKTNMDKTADWFHSIWFSILIISADYITESLISEFAVAGRGRLYNRLHSSRR
jgi:hypothetical protein